MLGYQGAPMSTLHSPLPKLDCNSDGAIDMGAKIDTLPN